MEEAREGEMGGASRERGHESRSAELLPVWLSVEKWGKRKNELMRRGITERDSVFVSSYWHGASKTLGMFRVP